MDQKPQQLGAADRWLYHYNDFIPKIVRPSSNGGSIQALMAFLQERLPQQVLVATSQKIRTTMIGIPLRRVYQLFPDSVTLMDQVDQEEKRDQGSLPMGELCLAVVPPISKNESQYQWTKRLFTIMMLWTGLLLAYHFIVLARFTRNSSMMLAHIVSMFSYALAWWALFVKRSAANRILLTVPMRVLTLGYGCYFVFLLQIPLHFLISISSFILWCLLDYSREMIMYKWFIPAERWQRR